MKNYTLLIEKFKDIIKVKENTNKYHTYKTEGVIEVVAEPTNISQIKDILSFCKKHSIKHIVIGNGSNILFKEGHYEGVVITTRKLNQVNVKDNKITCSCGTLMPVIALNALNNELTGFERLGGIPGTLGGAVVMNAGAYGSEMKDVLTEITIVDENFDIKEVSSDFLDLKYRHSNIKEKGYIVLGATISLNKGIKCEIKKLMDELKEKRCASQPLEYPNAGSVFKREGEHFAGQLIEQSGFKGYKVGDAMVSNKHANFIVNTGNATYSDIVTLIEEIKKGVLKNTNVRLNMEIEIV